jgi:hypothetical protein
METPDTVRPPFQGTAVVRRHHGVDRTCWSKFQEETDAYLLWRYQIITSNSYPIQMMVVGLKSREYLKIVVDLMESYRACLESAEDIGGEYPPCRHRRPPVKERKREGDEIEELKSPHDACVLF